jgi:hypothetical protein
MDIDSQKATSAYHYDSVMICPLSMRGIKKAPPDLSHDGAEVQGGVTSKGGRSDKPFMAVAG